MHRNDSKVASKEELARFAVHQRQWRDVVRWGKADGLRMAMGGELMDRNDAYVFRDGPWNFLYLHEVEDAVNSRRIGLCMSGNGHQSVGELVESSWDGFGWGKERPLDLSVALPAKPVISKMEF